MNQFDRALQEAWRGVTAQDVSFGGAAYLNYRTSLADFAFAYSFDLRPAVLAFVILSPTNGIMGNLRGLKTCMHAVRIGAPAESFSVSGYDRWKVRAMAALRGEVTIDDLKGPKIRAFYDNILKPFTSREICIDGHMICMAHGASMNMTGAQQLSRSIGYQKTYNEISKSVWRIASQENLPPQCVQAILWTSRRRQIGAEPPWHDNRPISPGEVTCFVPEWQ